MKSSLFMLSAFVAGILAGRFHLLPEALLEPKLALIALYLLLFLIGVKIAGGEKALQSLGGLRFELLLSPLAVVVGTSAAMAVLGLLLPGLNLGETLAIGSGFGYYSLSSILITQLRGESLGTLALLTNLLREILTLITLPLWYARFGRLAPIASGGGTTMDTTLPIITKYCGEESVVTALFSGMVLTFLVPFLVSFWLAL